MRARYYQGMMDTVLLQKKKGYSELSEMYIIFITPFNPLKKYNGNGIVHDKVSCEVKRSLDGVDWSNKVHEIYLNTEETDNTELSKMLKYFEDTRADDTSFGALSDAVRRRKLTVEGNITMCKAVEDYAVKYADKYAKKAIEKATKEANIRNKVEFVDSLLDDGITLSKALKLAKIDEQIYKEAKAK